LTAKDVADARHEMEEATFKRDRLQTAVTRLRDRLAQLIAQEGNNERWIAYRRAQAVRDKYAAELKALYPEIEAQLRDLMIRMEANDKEIV